MITDIETLLKSVKLGQRIIVHHSTEEYGKTVSWLCEITKIADGMAMAYGRPPINNIAFGFNSFTMGRYLSVELLPRIRIIKKDTHTMWQDIQYSDKGESIKIIATTPNTSQSLFQKNVAPNI